MKMTRWTVTETDTGTRLDAWLAKRPEIGSRGRATAWLERGKVFLNGTAAAYADAGRRLQAGDEVRLWVDRPGTSSPARRDLHGIRDQLHIVREDQAILVADKPPGLLVEPLPSGRRRGSSGGPGPSRGPKRSAAAETGTEPTLLDLVADHLRVAVRVRPLVVHRIDRDTSGLVLFAKTPAAQQTLKEQFERRTPVRVYLAVVHGIVTPPSGTWRDRLVWDKEHFVQRCAHPRDTRAKEAIAHYRVLEQFPDAALLEVSLVTGKRNQIRVQAGLHGHPIVGERLYRFGMDRHATPAFDRQALHAARLGFTHPVTGKGVRLSAPPPDDLRTLIQRLKRQA